jgi:hypothetical protein
MFEADFLAPLELNDAPVVDHELDRSVPDQPERVQEFPEERRREGHRVVMAGVGFRRRSRMNRHGPIYPIWLI